MILWVTGDSLPVLAFDWSVTTGYAPRNSMALHRFQFVLAWLLITAQAVAAFGGPVGLLICRDADGSSHVERSSHSCCGQTQADLDRIGPSEFDTTSLVGSCIGGHCVDQPIDAGHATANLRNRVRGPGFRAPVTPATATITWSTLCSTSPFAPPQVVDCKCSSQPRQARLALRATILNL
jgi:hypothetical protein